MHGFGVKAAKDYKSSIVSNAIAEHEEKKQNIIDSLKAEIEEANKRKAIQVKEKIKYVTKIVKQNATNCELPANHPSVELLKQAASQYSKPLSALRTH